MLQCVQSSNILKASLDLVPENEHDEIVSTEFEKMCRKFRLNEYEMISFVTEKNISLLANNYANIMNGLIYYSMNFLDEYIDKYIENMSKYDFKDARINMLPDDLQEYIKKTACINVKNDNRCGTFALACERKHDHCVKYLLDNSSTERNHNECYYYQCHRNLFNYMCSRNCSLNIIKYMIETKNIDCMYHDKSKIIQTYAIDNTCRRGQLDVVQYLFEKQNKVGSHEAMISACEHGHLVIVQYLLEKQNYSYSVGELLVACAHGHLNIVKYLFGKLNNVDLERVIEIASQNGHLNIVKYLLEELKIEKPQLALYAACEHNHLNIVKYLFEDLHKDYEIDDIIGHVYFDCLDIIKYFVRVQRKKITRRTMGAFREYKEIYEYLIRKTTNEQTNNML